MNAHPQRTEFLSALTTEHFVLQTANSSTYAEASARSTLYVMALSSSLVAMGFLAGSGNLLVPFAATVLPTIFLLGLFTVVRLVETALESMHYLQGIARIRGYYRTLGPDAGWHFSARNGRWPELESPAERLGPVLAFFGTTASMIAVINNAVGGACVALLVHTLLVHTLGLAVSLWMCAVCGAATAGLLTLLFFLYQRWRFEDFEDSKGMLKQE